jgi:hypothetical protein
MPRGARHRARKVLPRVPVVQQRIGLLAGNVDVDRGIRARTRPSAERALEIDSFVRSARSVADQPSYLNDSETRAR